MIDQPANDTARDPRCDEMRFLLQADVDGELTSAETARVAAHLDQCPACGATQTRLLALSEAVKSGAPRYPASATLERAVRLRLAEAPRPRFESRRLFSVATIPAFGGGFALAACLALLLVGPAASPLSDAVVAAHIRALQPGHLMDVVSTDQHTVKPWFDGRLPFAPPVKDLNSVGFPLAGGRLDYLADHTAAALIYRHGAHDINLFVWPDQGASDRSAAQGARDGYNFQRWSQDGMMFWAVTDLNPKDLSDFVERWRAF